MKIHTVILAAGEGSRMLSSKAKSLQPVGGHSMLKRIYETVQHITDEATFVVGYEKESIIKEANSFNGKINISEQEMQTEIQKQLRMMPGQEKMLQEYYQNNPSVLGNLRGQLYEEEI